MEQLKFGDTITWRCLNGTTSGIITSIIDDTTLLVKRENGKYVNVSVYSIQSVKHNE